MPDVAKPLDGKHLVFIFFFNFTETIATKLIFNSSVFFILSGWINDYFNKQFNDSIIILFCFIFFRRTIDDYNYNSQIKYE